jgi:hypothetical protein
VGNHRELVDKSLFRTPEPISFFVCVTKKELLIMELFSKEFRVIHLCCLDINKFWLILKSKNKG